METDRLIEIFRTILAVQQETLAELKIIADRLNQFPSQASQTDEELMNHLQVQKYLDISKSTYYRKVKEGKLKPMKLPGGDKYYKQDLLAEYNESKRRGRI